MRQSQELSDAHLNWGQHDNTDMLSHISWINKHRDLELKGGGHHSNAMMQRRAEQRDFVKRDYRLYNKESVWTSVNTVSDFINSGNSRVCCRKHAWLGGRLQDTHLDSRIGRLWNSFNLGILKKSHACCSLN